MTPKSYQDNFFNYHLQSSVSSAEEILPVVLELIQPSSVIDIGCGVGTWLHVWEKYGINNILGVDGAYVDKENLLIDKNKFFVADLEKKLELEKKFDLVTCLEVAEHIAEHSAKQLIESLCRLGDIVLFSAAVPGQEGTLHINEQYPNYWLILFKANGFVPVDCVRRKVWSNQNVSWWYRQNMLFYVRDSKLALYPKLKEEAVHTSVSFLNMIHPELFEYKNSKIARYENILKSPVSALSYFIRSYLSHIKLISKR